MAVTVTTSWGSTKIDPDTAWSSACTAALLGVVSFRELSRKKLWENWIIGRTSTKTYLVTGRAWLWRSLLENLVLIELDDWNDCWIISSADCPSARTLFFFVALSIISLFDLAFETKVWRPLVFLSENASLLLLCFVCFLFAFSAKQDSVRTLSVGFFQQHQPIEAVGRSCSSRVAWNTIPSDSMLSRPTIQSSGMLLLFTHVPVNEYSNPFEKPFHCEGLK